MNTQILFDLVREAFDAGLKQDFARFNSCEEQVAALKAEKAEQAEQEVPHCNAGPGYCQQCADDEITPPPRQPLTDAVIEAARKAMDESFEAGNDAMDICIPAHLAAALSLCLDEYEAAHGIKDQK